MFAAAQRCVSTRSPCYPPRHAENNDWAVSSGRVDGFAPVSRLPGKAKAFRLIELLQGGDTYAEQAAQPASVPEPGSGTADGPLTGVKVLEFTTGVTGPLAASMLADTGADVIKVERKFDVDPARRAGTGPLHFGATYVALNRNKRAITLNPNAAETARQVERLLGWADVVLIDAASEGAFKVSAATATAARPRLLYTKIEPGPGEYELQALTGPAGNQVTSVPGLADRFTVAAPLFPPRLLPSGLSAFAVLDVQFVPVTATLPLTRLDFPL